VRVDIKVSKEAAEELEEAAAWYEEEQPGLGVEVIDAITPGNRGTGLSEIPYNPLLQHIYAHGKALQFR
jgi:hypothetical protein